MRVLDTLRLHLRPLGLSDEALYCRIYTDPELMRHVAAPLSAEAAQRSFRLACRGDMNRPRRWRLWVMSDATTHAETGLAGLVGDDDSAEIGAMLLAPYQDQGYALEALTTLVEYAFSELQLSGLWGHHPSANHRSGRIMQRLGFLPVPPTVARFDLRWELSRSQWAEQQHGR
jgi:ribosomal-protein-alanine N-acetyltransferase